ncbi:MAG: hypothetical protein IJE89_06410, partial [Bacilli bacterium]|nr:hypothetical protein [Bacilli bacterium]
MKNKLRAILLVLVLMFSFMLNVNAEIKEDPKEYVGDAFVIGSSRFDASIIVTGTMASKAGAREMIIQYNVYENYDFDPEDIKVYYYSGIDEAWAVLPETSEDEFRFLDEDEAKELEENLNIYYVNEEEKTLEIPFEFEIELEEGFELEYYTHSESHAKRIKYENGKLIMPASTGYLEIVATKGSWEDDDYESIRIVGIKQEEGELEIESASVVSEETLQSLIDGGTGNIQLVESIDLKTALEITKNVSIYIPSDVTLSVKNDTTGNGVFHVLDGGSLNIYGEGTIDAAGKSGTAMAIYAEGGKVILEGNVTYTNNNYTPAEGEELLDQYDLIYAKNDAEIIIGGGIFECKTPLWTLNVEENSDANISVSGGQFYGFNPASYLSEEHKIDAYDSVYWVSQIYESDIAMIGTTAYQFLEQAIAMAPAKSTIKLLRDIELNSMVVVDKELTLDLNGHKIDVIEDFVDYSVFKVIENGKLTITGEGTVDSASQGNDYSMAIWAVNGG